VSSRQQTTQGRDGFNSGRLEEKHAGDDSLALLKALAEASAVFVAFTFIGGWSYLSSYYSAFGLNPLELDMPVPVVCTTAVYVLFDAKWSLILVAALALGWWILPLRLRRSSRIAGPAVLTLLLLTVSTSGIVSGRRRASEDATTDSSSLPFVAFAVKLPKNDQPACVDFQTYGSLDCKLLLHSKSTYYFFEPIPNLGKGSLNVYTLSDADVGGAHILRGLDRNARAN
jgi:hypothetical protein